MSDPRAIPPERRAEADEDLAEAREHHRESTEHRREATADRTEAAADRTEAAADRAEAAAEGTVAATGAASSGNGHGLLGDEQRRRFRSRWDDVEASFIDEPRDSVAHADALVREATDALHSIFERDRRQLEGVWDRGDDVSTEDLRLTLQRYRSFFERLLSL